MIKENNVSYTFFSPFIFVKRKLYSSKVVFYNCRKFSVRYFYFSPVPEVTGVPKSPNTGRGKVSRNTRTNDIIIILLALLLYKHV